MVTAKVEKRNSHRPSIDASDIVTYNTKQWYRTTTNSWSNRTNNSPHLCYNYTQQRDKFLGNLVCSRIDFSDFFYLFYTLLCIELWWLPLFYFLFQPLVFVALSICEYWRKYCKQFQMNLINMHSVKWNEYVYWFK